LKWDGRIVYAGITERVDVKSDAELLI